MKRASTMRLRPCGLGCCLGALPADTFVVLDVPAYDVLLFGAGIVNGRDERCRLPDVDEDHALDPPRQRVAEAVRVPVEGHGALEEGAAVDDRGVSLEAVTPPGDRVDDVDFYRRVAGQVGNRPRRADIGEYQMVVVPHGGGALRRQVRRAVGADGGHEAEPLLPD